MDNKELSGMEKMVLAVSYNVETDKYSIGACQGSSVSEMAFAVMVVIKTLIRDGYLKDSKEFLDKVTTYLADPQFSEVKE